MMTYNYREAVTADVLDYIRENIDLSTVTDWDELEQQLNDDLWTVDSVTGNGSGSYTFNRWQAEEYICHNPDLLDEAMAEFGCESVNAAFRGAEWCDVTIRCYLLGECIAAALEELREEIGEVL